MPLDQFAQVGVLVAAVVIVVFGVPSEVNSAASRWLARGNYGRETVDLERACAALLRSQDV